MPSTTPIRAPTSSGAPLLLLIACLGCGGPTSSAIPPGSSADPPADPAMVACSMPSECVVVARTCCGRCGAATSGDAMSVSAAYVREHHGYACEGADRGCPDCYEPTEPTLRGTCRDGRCEVLDLASRDLAACDRDEACVLRNSVCCDCGAAPWIAVRADRVAAVSEALCGAIATCPACAAPYPTHLRARCIESRCVAVEE